MAHTTTLTLFLGLLALMSTLCFIAEARPQPIDEDFGTIIGPHTRYEDDFGTLIGPNVNEDTGNTAIPHPNLDDDDLGTVIGPDFEVHKKDFPKDFIFGTSVSAYQVNIRILLYTLYSHTV